MSNAGLNKWYSFLLVVTITFLFITTNKLWAWSDWGVIAYGGDAHQVMAIVKAYAAGDATPFGEKIIEHLGAPFGANWYDFPFEDAIWVLPGMLAKWMDVPHALMIYLLAICCAAAASFSFTGISLGYRRELVFAASVLFAFSPYLFARNFGHMNLAAYWHLPLLLYALVILSYSKNSHYNGRKIRQLCLIGVCAGLLSVYYLYPFLFIAGLIGLGQLIERRYSDARVVAYVIGSALLAFVVQHLDTFYFIYTQGANPGALVRGLEGLARWGLRLDDLIFPYAHRIESIQMVANWHTAKVLSVFKGEAQFAYIGVVSVIALAWLLLRGASGLATGERRGGSVWFPFAVIIILLGIVGGVNFLLGNFGLVFFRATNRFSIILTAIALLFLCETISKWKVSLKHSIALAVAVLVTGLFDQIPAGNRDQVWVEQTKHKFAEDKKFAMALEKRLQLGAMVFQLPVVQYPESGELVKMADYSHFRPYIYTENIRYSYGSIKGRGDTDWQGRVGNLPAPQMIKSLEEFGFDAVMINRSGFSDMGESLIAAFHKANKDLVADYDDLVAFRLDPARTPLLPRLMHPIMEDGFYSSESDGTRTWNWAKDKAVLVFRRFSFPSSNRIKPSKAIVAHFKLQGLARGNVWMSVDDGPLVQVLSLEQVESEVSVPIGDSARKVSVSFKSDIEARTPGNSDPRLLSFRILDLTID